MASFFVVAADLLGQLVDLLRQARPFGIQIDHIGKRQRQRGLIEHRLHRTGGQVRIDRDLGDAGQAQNLPSFAARRALV